MLHRWCYDMLLHRWCWICCIDGTLICCIDGAMICCCIDGAGICCMDGAVICCMDGAVICCMDGTVICCIDSAVICCIDGAVICCMDGAVICYLPAGLYSSSLTARLAHLCDTVVGLEAVRDDSDIVRVIPEPARYVSNSFLSLHYDASVCCHTSLLWSGCCAAIQKSV